MFFFFFENDENLELYDTKMEVFSKNETESLEFYKYLALEDEVSLLKRLNEEVIPKWNENTEIIKKMNQLDGLPEEVKEQNKILLRYSELRLESFKLFKKAISEDTSIYDRQLDKIHSQIEQELSKLQN